MEPLPLPDGLAPREGIRPEWLPADWRLARNSTSGRAAFVSPPRPGAPFGRVRYHQQGVVKAVAEEQRLLAAEQRLHAEQQAEEGELLDALELDMVERDSEGRAVVSDEDADLEAEGRIAGDEATASRNSEQLKAAHDRIDVLEDQVKDLEAEVNQLRQQLQAERRDRASASDSTSAPADIQGSARDMLTPRSLKLFDDWKAALTGSSSEGVRDISEMQRSASDLESHLRSRLSADHPVFAEVIAATDFAAASAHDLQISKRFLDDWLAGSGDLLSSLHGSSREDARDVLSDLQGYVRELEAHLRSRLSADHPTLAGLLKKLIIGNNLVASMEGRLKDIAERERAAQECERRDLAEQIIVEREMALLSRMQEEFRVQAAYLRTRLDLNQHWLVDQLIDAHNAVDQLIDAHNAVASRHFELGRVVGSMRTSEQRWEHAGVRIQDVDAEDEAQAELDELRVVPV